MYKFLLLRTVAFSIAVFVPLMAQTGEDDSSTSSPAHVIYVLTFEPGADLFAAFGHAAIVVEYTVSGSRKVYNFGTFDFHAPDTKWRYAKGELEYWLSVASYESTLKRYLHFGRGGTLAELDLPQNQATWLAQELQDHTHPDKRRYIYRHFDNNCCTKVRNLLNRASGNRLSLTFDSKPASRTYRQWTRHLTRDFPLWGAAIDFVLGPEGDRPISRFEEQYLPGVLSVDLNRVRLGEQEHPLVKKVERFEPTGPAPKKKDRVPLIELLLAFAAFAMLAFSILPIILGNRKAARRLLGGALVLYGITTGILGAVLVFFSFTSHSDTHGNENHLITPLTHLWMVVPGTVLLISGGLGRLLSRGIGIYLWVALGLLGLDLAVKILPMTTQDNWRYLLPSAMMTALLIAAKGRCLSQSVANLQQ